MKARVIVRLVGCVCFGAGLGWSDLPWYAATLLALGVLLIADTAEDIW